MSTDLFKDGAGDVFLQLHGDAWHLVAYRASSLTDPETQYVQIEKEVLSIMFWYGKVHAIWLL